MILSISLFEIINVVISDPKIFFWIAASVAYAVAVKPNGIRTIFLASVSTFFFNGKTTLFNVGRKLMSNPPS